MSSGDVPPAYEGNIGPPPDARQKNIAKEMSSPGKAAGGRIFALLGEKFDYGPLKPGPEGAGTV